MPDPGDKPIPFWAHGFDSLLTLRLIVGPSYDIIPLARPGAKTGSRQFFEIESLKVA